MTPIINDLENYKVNAGPKFNYKYPPSLKLHFVTSLFELHAIVRHVHQITQNDLQHYQIKGTPYILY